MSSQLINQKVEITLYPAAPIVVDVKDATLLDGAVRVLAMDAGMECRVFLVDMVNNRMRMVASSSPVGTFSAWEESLRPLAQRAEDPHGAWRQLCADVAAGIDVVAESNVIGKVKVVDVNEELRAAGVTVYAPSVVTKEAPKRVDFSTAMRELGEGVMMSREAWGGSVWVEMRHAADDEALEGAGLYRMTKSGTRQSYLASWEDMQAHDWVTYDLSNWA